MKFYPYKKRGRASFSHPEEGGGGIKGAEVVLTQGLEVLMQKVSDLRFSYLLTPLPVIIDQSLY